MRFMTAMSCCLTNLEFTQSQGTSICLVVYNASYITLAGGFFYFIFVYIYIYLTSHRKIACWSLHNWSSGSCHHPFSAFADVVEEYEADSEMDDKGNMMNA